MNVMTGDAIIKCESMQIEKSCDTMVMSEETGAINWERYPRQMSLAGVGKEGQRKLAAAKVLIVGAGGLGTPIAMYLAGAGIGTLGIMDADEVSVTNLHRQVMHPTSRLGMNKAESAKLSMGAVNDEVQVHVYPYMLTVENAENIISDYDFVVIAVDSFEARFLINDTCVKLGKPFSNGAITALEGQAMTYVPGQGPCYRCVFEEPPAPGEVPTAAEIGVMGPAVGVIGSIQAMEVMKYFLGLGELLTGKMFTMDGLTMKTRVLRLGDINPDCPVCNHRK